MSRIPEGLVKPTDYRADNNEYFSTDGRFVVQRYSSTKWIVKDLSKPGSAGIPTKFVCYCKTLADAPVEIEHYLREEKAEEIKQDDRARRAQSLAANFRGVPVFGGIQTNDENFEGLDAAEYVERQFLDGSHTVQFTLDDLERIVKHVKGDQYRGPG